MEPLYAGALLAGLAGSPHCVAMCGAFAASCSRVPGGLPAWHVGRILTYSLLGGLAGFLGAALPGPAWVPAALATAFLLWFVGALAGLWPEPHLMLPLLARFGSGAAGRRSLGSQFLFGVVNGFLPCGLVYAALGMPLALADPLKGALTMTAFGLGTIPAVSLAALGLRRILARSLTARRLLACLVLGAGLWSIWMRATGSHMVHGPHPMAPPAAGP